MQEKIQKNQHKCKNHIIEYLTFQSGKIRFFTIKCPECKRRKHWSCGSIYSYREECYHINSIVFERTKKDYEIYWCGKCETYLVGQNIPCFTEGYIGYDILKERYG